MTCPILSGSMATQRETLKAEPRTDFGSRTTRRLRRAGQVPGVVYSGGEDARPFQVGARDLRNVLLAGHALFDLDIEGQGAVPVVVKDQQLHPVRGEITHLDLQQVRLDEKIQAEVTIELVGAEDAPGSKEGGVLEHIARELTVEALPTDIPEQIVIDVSHMEINDTIQLSSVTPPSGVEFITAEDADELTIATLTPPRLEKELEEIEEEAALVGEEQAAGEETPDDEGEAPEGESAGEDSGGSGGE